MNLARQISGKATSTLAVPEMKLHEASSSETLNSPRIPDSPSPKKKTEWGMTPQVIRNAQRDEAAGFKRRELGVTWQNLTVEVPLPKLRCQRNMISQFNVPQLVKDMRGKPPLKSILSDSHGCVKPGEMLLVLGRPGSGCTTLLKMLANSPRRISHHQG
ncbi:ABC transporter sequence [Penicillium atrosanguineum]|nr:ABC transporter sequence [Penicillium atrosanguineum]